MWQHYIYKFYFTDWGARYYCEPRNCTSKPNERSCRIFLEKLLRFLLLPLFFFIFLNFPEKCLKKLFNEVSSKQILKFFTVNFIEKNFEIFLLLNSLKSFLQDFFGKFKKMKKQFFGHKKEGGNSGKSLKFFHENPTWPFVGF